MGTTVVFSNGTGVGKTSFITAQLKHLLMHEGRARFRKCCAQIDRLNENRKTPLSKPDRAPIYANFDVNIKTGYKKSYSPYFLNPYYFGLPNQGKKVMPVVPWSVFFIQEADDVYDSSDKAPLAAAVKGIYNKRRHWNIDVWIELHRSMALNVSIRDIADRFIEVVKKESKYDLAGRTISTTWTLREFDTWRDVESYLDSKLKGQSSAKLYTEYTFTNEGNIFNCYDNEECADEFIPVEGDDFVLLPQKNKIDVQTLPPEQAIFYADGAPPDFRQKTTKTKPEAKAS